MQKIYTVFFSVIILMSCGNLSHKENVQDVIPLKNDTTGKYYFSFSNIYFEINPEAGGRVTSFKINGNEVLYVNSSYNGYGSTFWPSPQGAWIWPPLKAIDSSHYNVVIRKNKIFMTSGIDDRTKLSLTKIFTANNADTSVSIIYILKNSGKAIQSWAPWEITRVPANGIVFYKKGDSAPKGKMAGDVKEMNGYLWYDQDSTTSSKDHYKFVSDAKGWIACVNHSKQLLVKVFPDIPVSDFAPGEAEIEVYTHPDHSFSEVENQGRYTPIKPNDSLCWTVKWYLRQLSSDIRVTPGSRQVIDQVKRLIK